MRLLFLILLASVLVQAETTPQTSTPTASKSEPLCPNAKTQAEINDCMAGAAERADRDLQHFYIQIVKKLDVNAVSKLQAAENAWIRYRDANCDAEAIRYGGGSIVPATRSACLERNTRDRIAELHRVYDTGTR